MHLHYTEYTYAYWVDFVNEMSLLKWIRAKNPALPSSSTRDYSSLSKKDLESANEGVKRALDDEKVATPRGKYNSYTPEERARIGKS